MDKKYKVIYKLLLKNNPYDIRLMKRDGVPVGIGYKQFITTENYQDSFEIIKKYWIKE